jgi:hypothetical protein
MVKAVAELADSARLLLDAVGDPSDVTLIRSWGNRGDDLIYAGLRRLLRDYSYRECDIRKLDQAPEGQTAIVSGGGSWCKPFHAIPEILPAVEARFSRVIVFPSSFDTEEAIVHGTLSRTGAVIFARELESYERIRHLCDARLAHDTAFFFDFSPYQSGFHHGVLNAFRDDAEAAGAPVPQGNRDISMECASLDEWLWTISRHDLIRTDRAHVAIAAAMLGKSVECRSTNYHKVPGIVRYSLSSSSVNLLDGSGGDGANPADVEAAQPLPQVSQVDRVASRTTLLNAEIARLTSLLAARDAELARSVEENLRLEAENQLLARQLAASEAAVRALERELESASESLRAREGELGETVAELRDSRKDGEALRASWSWRLTAPLRRLMDLALRAQAPRRGDGG